MISTATIEEACELVTDGTHYTPANVGRGVPFLTVKDVFDSSLDFEQCAFIAEDDYRAAKAGNSAPQRGDVLFSKDGTVGKVHVVDTDRPFAVLSSLAILRPKRNLVDSRYFGHVLRSPRVLDDALKRRTGSAIRRVILSDLKRVRVPLPSLPEQRRIATILDTASALRAKRRAALSHGNSLIQSIYLEMFGAGPTARHGWHAVQLRDLCETIIDCPHSTPIYTHAHTPYPCVRSSDIQDSELSFSDTKYVEKTEYEKRIARAAPQVGDVIYCREGARFGNAARIVTEMSLCLGQRMMLFRPKKDLATTEYLWAFLSSSAAYHQAIRMAGGSASPHVNIREIVTFRVPVPPIQLQHEFARRVHAIDRQMASMRASLAQLNVLASVLEHRAFDGTDR